MWLDSMANRINIYFVIQFCLYLYVFCEDNGMCGDPDCSEAIASGVTNQMYNPVKKNMLGFSAGEKVKIYVRDYGPKKLLGVEINGQRGYVSKTLIQEKSKHKNAEYPAKREFVNEDSPKKVASLASISSESFDLQQSTEQLIHPSPDFIPGATVFVESHRSTLSTDYTASFPINSNQNGFTNENIVNPSSIAEKSTEEHYLPQFIADSSSRYSETIEKSFSSLSDLKTLPTEVKASTTSIHCDESALHCQKYFLSPTVQSSIDNSIDNNLQEILFNAASFVENHFSETIRIVSDSNLPELDNDAVSKFVNAELLETISLLEKNGLNLSDFISEENSHAEIADSIHVTNDIFSIAKISESISKDKKHYISYPEKHSDLFPSVHENSIARKNSREVVEVDVETILDQNHLKQTEMQTMQEENKVDVIQINHEFKSIVPIEFKINEKIVVDEEKIDQINQGEEFDSNNNDIGSDSGETGFNEIKNKTLSLETDKEFEHNTLSSSKISSTHDEQGYTATIHKSKTIHNHPKNEPKVFVNKDQTKPFIKGSFNEIITKPTESIDRTSGWFKKSYVNVDSNFKSVAMKEKKEEKIGKLHQKDYFEIKDGNILSTSEDENPIVPKELGDNFISTNHLPSLNIWSKTKNLRRDETEKIDVKESYFYTNLENKFGNVYPESEKKLPMPNSKNVDMLQNNAKKSFPRHDSNNTTVTNSRSSDFSENNFKKKDSKLFPIENRENFEKSKVIIHTPISDILPENDCSKLPLDSIKLEKSTEPIEDYNLMSTAQSCYTDQDFTGDCSTESSLGDLNSYTGNSESWHSVTVAFEAWRNSIEALRSFLQNVILWIPEPVQTYLVELDASGISARAVVFTLLSAFPCVFLIVAVLYIKQSSKEKVILDQLMLTEQKLYLASTERNVLQEETKNMNNQLSVSELRLEEEKIFATELKNELQNASNISKGAYSELKVSMSMIQDLKKKNAEHLNSIAELGTERKEWEEKNQLSVKDLQEKEYCLSDTKKQLKKLEEEIQLLQKEKQVVMKSQEEDINKISQLERSCNQLLQEAEVWNARVNELTQQLSGEITFKEELACMAKSRDNEILSLKTLFASLKIIEDLKNFGETDEKTIEEKLKMAMDVKAVQNQLSSAETEGKLLSEQLNSEKSKVLELEVEVLDTKSEVEKLKLKYIQALQDKTEAQTKLDVLSNYFKDKELQLQKELGAQEAVRQQKEEDANLAERHVCLINEENASYKFQVATLKQEIEETERNFKNQVAAQEKKAHENWLAARGAERKLEEVKQEACQLRQRLTLLEREQETWIKSSQEEIIRPIPKNFSVVNDVVIQGSQDARSSLEFSTRTFHPPAPLEHIHPLPHLMIPSNRPLPPPPLLSFIPHIDPLMPPPLRPQPWRFLPEQCGESTHSVEKRNIQSEFEKAMSSSPSKYQSPAVFDKEIEHFTPPLRAISRDSRTSSPLNQLPHFHNFPPHQPRPYDFPPSIRHIRFPIPPVPQRREPNLRTLSIQTGDPGEEIVTSPSQSDLPKLGYHPDLKQHPNPREQQ